MLTVTQFGIRGRTSEHVGNLPSIARLGSAGERNDLRYQLEANLYRHLRS